QRQSRTEYLLTQFRVIVAYLRLTVLPTWQSLDPQVRTSHTLLEGTTLGSLTILLALLAARVYHNGHVITYNDRWGGGGGRQRCASVSINSRRSSATRRATWPMCARPCPIWKRT
ncbi:MAG: hypothetical protein QGF68_05345, partial [Nitrospinota bacterium]|nr:hypothetical protein [Nitrospinota bacterium]